MIITTAMGISIGDGIKTSYNSGPYEVKSISAPRKFVKNPFHIVIRDHPVISLVLRDLDGKSNTDSYISNIRRAGEDRFATDQNDEIFVEKKNIKHIVQLGLFDAPIQQPPDYPFEKECDYRAGAGRVWHCERCAKDFNSAEKHQLPYSCPVCEKSHASILSTCVPIFYIEAPPPGDWRPRPSEAMMTFNLEDYLPREERNIAKAA